MYDSLVADRRDARNDRPNGYASGNCRRFYQDDIRDCTVRTLVLLLLSFLVLR